MTLSIDKLLSIFDEAYENRARLEFPTREMKLAMSRAAMGAVIKALRDEYTATVKGCETVHTSMSRYDFNEILGDAGEKVVGGAASRQTESCRPTTDPAPAVCELTMGFETYENRKWWRADCGWSFYGKPPFVNCPSCGKPITFTEAK